MSKFLHTTYYVVAGFLLLFFVELPRMVRDTCLVYRDVHERRRVKRG